MIKSIKIFVDCHVFDGSFQGTTTYLKGLYLEMIKNKDFEFFFAGNNLEIIIEIFGTQDNVHYLKYKSHNKFYRLLVDIPRFIKQNNIDYAHFQYIVPPLKYCKYINTIHDVLFLDFPEYFPISYRIKNEFLFKWSAKHSDIILTVSDYSKKQIQKHFAINEILITPNAVEPVYFENYDKPAVQNEVKKLFGIKDYCLFISRWEPRKNHHTLLEVFVENKFYNKFSLLFIGDKSIENKKFNDYFFNLPEQIKSKIYIFNKVDAKDLLLFLRGAKMSIYPSFAEGFGIPPLESAAAGVPIICSNTTAMSDFWFLKKTLFNPSKKEELKDKIELLLTETKPVNISSIIQKNYNWKISASILVHELKKYSFLY